ncbi:MAG: flagellar basal body P-ring formation protein FlgA [Syntrophobacterales bacterium]|nr:MAG: flagellar basal body P-ring formation protein FlgA [Syntrophobacterales bacterium]
MMKKACILKYVTGLFLAAFVMVAVCEAAPAATTTIGEETIKRVVTEYITKNMPWPTGSVRIAFHFRIPDATLSGENIVCRVEGERREDFVGYSNFTVGFYDKKVFRGEQSVRVKLEVSRDVVVSARYLPRGTDIQGGDVKLVQKWFEHMPSRVISSLEEAVGKRLSTSAKQNTEITRDMLREPVMVSRGKQVQVVLERGPVKITTVGLSEQNGSKGDVVKVRNLSSNQSIYATVVGESLVRVDF